MLYVILMVHPLVDIDHNCDHTCRNQKQTGIYQRFFGIWSIKHYTSSRTKTVCILIIPYLKAKIKVFIERNEIMQDFEDSLKDLKSLIETLKSLGDSL